uniref:Uncharacterized protein n=1 Tax=Kalanchoe fedtschenkoi TaxID=63787 RepID=A0A7N0TSZ7_KALFE
MCGGERVRGQTKWECLIEMVRGVEFVWEKSVDGVENTQDMMSHPALNAATASEDGGGLHDWTAAAAAATRELDGKALGCSTYGGYHLPPPEIRDIVDAPPAPTISFSPNNDRIMFLKRRALPPLADLAKPEAKLAGIRIDVECNIRSRVCSYSGIGIHQLMPDGSLGPETNIHGFPDDAAINFVGWSPNGRHLSFNIRYNEVSSNRCLLMVKHHIDLESFGRTYGLRSVGKSYICLNFNSQPPKLEYAVGSCGCLILVSGFAFFDDLVILGE